MRIVLLGICLLWAGLGHGRPPAPVMPSGPGAEAGPAAVQVIVKGMVCSFCVQGVEKMLRQLPAVKDLAIDLKARQVSLWVEGTPPSDRAINETIKDAGYEVESIIRLPKKAPKGNAP